MKNNEKKYRICYDRSFNTKDYSFKHDGKVVVGIVLWFEYKYYKNGKEILFTENDDPGVDIYTCYYDKEKGYRLELNIEKIRKLQNGENYYPITTSLDKVAGIQYDNDVNEYPITSEEALSILINNPEIFDCPDNYIVQNCAIRYNEVKTREK